MVSAYLESLCDSLNVLRANLWSGLRMLIICFGRNVVMSDGINDGFSLTFL